MYAKEMADTIQIFGRTRASIATSPLEQELLVVRSLVSNGLAPADEQDLASALFPSAGPSAY